MFAEVILPLPLPGLFTYSIPTALQDVVGVGCRVTVPFGRNKHYTAIIRNLHTDAPATFRIKEIHFLIDSQPVVTEQQLQLWEWISFYYLSPIGDVYKAALPSSMQPADLATTFVAKTETFFRLHPESDTATIAEKTSRAKKQQLLLAAIVHYFQENGKDSLPKSTLTLFPGYSPSVLNGLLTKGVLQSFTVETGRLDPDLRPTRKPSPLNPYQQKALQEIRNCFTQRQTCLLHGVICSGKTEIYIHLVTQYLAEGKQVLYLLPEIALTAQLTARLQAVFGSKMGVYHSKVNDNERAEIWKKMLSDTPYEIILGVRSSIFLPFRRLGLVIVDEEHEPGYKQQEPAPRYHARDTAIMLARFFGAQTLLGSATPSVESYLNAQSGKYGRVLLSRRFDEMPLPELLFEDCYELRRRKKMQSSLAPRLIACMEEALWKGEQVILFRNRRGYAPVIICKNCGHTPKCPRCEVSLTYHKQGNMLKCHYCNASYPATRYCPHCEEESMEPVGQGTEKLEEELKRLFPDASVARMDADTVAGKKTCEKILSDFQERRIQILVGTQMLTKALDCDHVCVVGIIAADALFNRPDFRSQERGFQQITQAAGRAAGKQQRSRVIIQTSDPEMPVYRAFRDNDPEVFYRAEIAERKLFHYPPFYRLITIVIKDRNEERAATAAQFFADQIRKSLGERVSPPGKPIISRVRGYYLREILLKLENGLSPQKVRELLKKTEILLRSNFPFKHIHLYYDVDPV